MKKMPFPPESSPRPNAQNDPDILLPLYKKGIDLEGFAIWFLIVGGVLMFLWGILK